MTMHVSEISKSFVSVFSKLLTEKKVAARYNHRIFSYTRFSALPRPVGETCFETRVLGVKVVRTKNITNNILFEYSTDSKGKREWGFGAR